jgi:tetratricopeptide (TPR) repeat protein
MKVLVAFLMCFTIIGPSPSASSPSHVEEGLAAWARRAENSRGPVAREEPIAEAVAAFERALELEETNLEARAWLLKALWFQGEHTGLADDEKLDIFERARNIAQEGIEAMASAQGLDSRELSPAAIASLREKEYAAETYFWCAAHWGLWGRYRGKIAAARQGAAAKIRDYAEITIALDEQVEGAGGHRILGRLHAEAPRLPIVTGWIDRDEAVRLLERATEIAPGDWLNELYFLEALIEFEPGRSAGATERLRAFTARRPRPETRVEDHKILQDAKSLLHRLEGE